MNFVNWFNHTMSYKMSNNNCDNTQIKVPCSCTFGYRRSLLKRQSKAHQAWPSGLCVSVVSGIELILNHQRQIWYSVARDKLFLKFLFINCCIWCFCSNPVINNNGPLLLLVLRENGCFSEIDSSNPCGGTSII